ncbi:hypothetical protein FNH22_07550 [Fulvivirga sp. M361]|uniref:hypothetical protein n=1 Tax=Fulvivirga sp. M361 TaxID=2594266 RepID=UPI00117B6FA3|nr:hypothetical protein [Fulvivirga sp. M361]TRX59900.1 hypothetical protein FNH22_07550 [Fulvivirga sp. M361]
MKTTEEKYTQLIDQQIQKLSAPDFDLEAWKGATKYVLSLVFGENNTKIAEIENLKIDYSSWALRDSASDYKPIEMCKKKGRELLIVAKDEVVLLGLNNQSKTSDLLLKSLLSEEEYNLFTDPAMDKEKKRGVLSKLKKNQLVDMLLPLLQG